MVKVWEEVGLREGEYLKIKEILGRDPNYLELGMFGLMWSEHCSYKHSRQILKRFPTKGERVIQGPGENAGVVDIDGNLAVALKIESHNHPSAIEPYQGAATGVGGIVRDIFAMGARPVALLDSLRFGDLENNRVRYIFGGVVSGIAGYGNCIGVPTVGGEVYFNECYNNNPLVNAMCVGLVERDKITKGIAKGEGNPVMLVGATTGRDGIHGASLLASKEFDQEPEEKRPAVQVGDPFMEKLLLEATLEVIEIGAAVGIQDLGAAGLTSASSEMASKGKMGIEIDVLKVPRREEGMTPYEVMLSESQERMLMVVERGREMEVEDIFDKWGLKGAVIGSVTADGVLRIKEGETTVAEIPADSLADNAPQYYPESRPPVDLEERQSLEGINIREPKDYNEVMLTLLGSPNIASREWIYRQYDYMVQTNTVIRPGCGDGSLIRLKGTNKALALTTDCNSRLCFLNPLKGGAMIVAEAARNLVVTGAKPIALTDCLNFASPERPEIFWQFINVIEGMSKACETLGIPVVSGNVSFYNETQGKAIHPTPVVGMVGLLDDIDKRITPSFKKAGELIYLLGNLEGEFDGSEYLKLYYKAEKGNPNIDLTLEKKLQEGILELIDNSLISAAHDCSEGGLACAIGEMSILGKLGAKININEGDMAKVLFGEGPSRVVITLPGKNKIALEEIANKYALPLNLIGKVAEKEIVVVGKSKGYIQLGIEEIENKWRGCIPCIMG
jgi:phosphoribosylformylglycinamidine synthase